MCGMLVYREVTATVAIEVSGDEEGWEEMENFKEMVGVCDWRWKSAYAEICSVGRCRMKHAHQAY